MKLTLPATAARAAVILTVAISIGVAGPQTGGQKPTAKTTPPTAAAEQALTEALTGPGGEYAAQVLYAAIVQKFGNVLPYATIVNSEGCHINALKRHFEMRGLPVPENPYTTPMQLPNTLREAAELAASAEERNITMYDRLIGQVKDQPDLVRVFSQLQWASRERHLPAFEAAAANDGVVGVGDFPCGAMGMGCGQQLLGGPPALAGCGQCCRGQSGCCGTCGASGPGQGAGKAGASKGPGRGWGAGPRFRGSQNL